MMGGVNQVKKKKYFPKYILGKPILNIKVNKYQKFHGNLTFFSFFMEF